MKQRIIITKQKIIKREHHGPCPLTRFTCNIYIYIIQVLSLPYFDVMLGAYRFGFKTHATKGTHFILYGNVQGLLKN